ncbi:hypothetical protein CLAIMM_09273, partial [Cladophialophora immunda]
MLFCQTASSCSSNILLDGCEAPRKHSRSLAPVLLAMLGKLASGSNLSFRDRQRHISSMVVGLVCGQSNQMNEPPWLPNVDEATGGQFYWHGTSAEAKGNEGVLLPLPWLGSF